MSSNMLFLLELLFGAGVALGFAVWELVQLKRYRDRHRTDAREDGP